MFQPMKPLFRISPCPLSTNFTGVPWWLSRLRIWHCHCSGFGFLSRELKHAAGMAKKTPPKQTNKQKNLNFTQSLYTFFLNNFQGSMS